MFVRDTGVSMSWDEVVALRNDLVQHGLPDDPTDLRVMIAEAVANAEGLKVLFAGQWDEGSRAYTMELVELWHTEVAWRRQKTHVGTDRRQ